MEQRNESISELLLSRLPQPANLAAYQQEVASLLAKNDEALRRSKSTVTRMWVFVIITSVPCLVAAGANYGVPAGNWFMGFVYFWVLLGAVEVGKYEAGKNKVDLLKEMKQIQLQILQLHSSIREGDGKRG